MRDNKGRFVKGHISPNKGIRKANIQSKEVYKQKAREYAVRNRLKINIQNLKSRNKQRFGNNKNMVFERDSWSCVKCNMNNEQHIIIFGRSLTVDHIDGNGRNSKNPNNNLNNLQTLCLRCHGKKDILIRSWRPVSINNQKEVG